MSIAINTSTNTLSLSESQLHGLISKEFKQATNLTTWESFKNFFIKLLNHLPYVSITDKEQVLKKLYNTIHCDDQKNITSHTNLESKKNISEIFLALNKVKEHMNQETIDNISLHISGVSFIGQGADFMATQTSQHIPIYLSIKIYDTALEPIYLDNSPEGIKNITNIFSRQLEQTSKYDNDQNHAFTFKKTGSEPLPLETDNDLSHILTLIDDMICKQDQNILTKEECHANILYLEKLLHTDTLKTPLIQEIINTLKTKQSNTAGIVDFAKLKNEWMISSPSDYDPVSSHVDEHLAYCDNKIKTNSRSDLRTADIINTLENAGLNFTKELDKEVGNLKAEINNLENTRESDFNPLLNRIEKTKKKIKNIGLHHNSLYIQENIKPEIDKLLTRIHEAQAEQTASLANQFMYQTINKNTSSLRHGSIILMDNNNSEMKTDRIDRNAHRSQVIDSYHEDTISEGSIHSLHIPPLTESEKGTSMSEKDSGLSSSSSQSSLNESSSLGSFTSKSEDQYEHSAVAEREIDIDTAIVLGENPNKKQSRVSRLARTFKQPFEKIAEVEARRTKLQNPLSIGK